ncbi:terpenoid synthase [Aspergillus aurantiobrunneus]
MAIGSSQESVWRSLEGQHVQVPNLLNLFPTFRVKIHSEYERSRDEVLNPWIRRWIESDKTCRKLQKAEFGLFAAIVCADTTFERFCTVAKYFAWYYIWDDIFDCGTLEETSSLKMSEYRQASMQYIQHQLLPENACPDLSPYPPQLQNALRSWEEVGTHIRSVCSKDTCTILSQAMLDYMSAVGDANALFENGRLPSLEDYWARRDYAAGVYPGIATIPFIYGVAINFSDVSNLQMMQLWKCTSYVVHTANDMLSLGKELNDGQIENLVPVLMLNEDLTINEAMQASYQLAEDNAIGIETALRNLQLDENRTAVVQAFGQGCRDLAAGLIYWSYSGERYFKATELDLDNIFHFQIKRP